MKTANPKIVIVEDDRFFANLIQQHLEHSNYTDIVVFHQGEDCIMQLYKRPDLIILDHQLGDTNGIDILRNIKSVNPNIPVIFLSAQEEMKVAVNALKYGAYDYIEKNENAFIRLDTMIKRIVDLHQIIQAKKRSKLLKWSIAAVSVLSLALSLMLI